jgi:hypothetical protein
MNDQRVKRVAYAHATGLGVENYVSTLSEVTFGIKICVANSGTGLNARNLSLLAD